MKRSAFALSILLLASIESTAQNSIQIGSDSRKSLDLTLYNQNLGLIREQRLIPPLKAGQQVILTDVSQQLQAESLRIVGAGKILEQNLNTNLLNQHSLLQAYLGKTLELVRFNSVTGEEHSDAVTLINIDGNRALIKRGNRYETIPLNGQWRFIFPSLPENLLTKPSLNFRSGGTGTLKEAHISYLTGGMNWSMDYVLTLNKAGDKVALDGLASLTNQTGSDYLNANINLLAGTLYHPSNQNNYRAKGREMMMAMSADIAPSENSEVLQDFYLYKLPYQTTLLNGQLKQVSLISAEQIPVKRYYDYQFLVYPSLERKKHQLKPDLLIQFKNNKGSDLGEALPAGKLRTFSPDSSGQLQYIGGTNINHTGIDDELEIKLGKAFDLSITRKQTSFSKVFNGHLVEQELTLSNQRDSESKLQLTANFPLAWQIKQSSHKYEKTEGGSAQWKLQLKPKSITTLRFKVELQKR